MAPGLSYADLPAWDGYWVVPGDSCEEAEPHVFDGAVNFHLKTDCTVTQAERMDLAGAWSIATECQEDARDFSQEYVLLMTVDDRMFIWYGEEHSRPLELERCE